MPGPAAAIPGLTVQLRRRVAGATLCAVPVEARDVAEPLAELGFELGLRRTGEPLTLAELEARVRPVRRAEDGPAGPCLGLLLEARAPDGGTARRVFGRDVLRPVASRASRDLIARGLLAEGDLYFYSIEVEETSIGRIEIDGIEPPRVERRPIEPLLARARRIEADPGRALADEAYALEQGRERPAERPEARARRIAAERRAEGREDEASQGPSPTTAHPPVFFEPEALALAERIARKGGDRSPPIETGGLLLGRLAFCPDSRWLYTVVHHVLEASNSEGSTYSLTFTDATWAGLQRVLEARARRPELRGERLVGSAHGHSFLPYQEGETCDGCPVQPACDLTTAYLSDSDRIWSRAVFPREPWQLALVFGLTPRRERVRALYGQRAARLVQRDYFVLESPSVHP